jgi:hypothetical protein
VAGGSNLTHGHFDTIHNHEKYQYKKVAMTVAKSDSGNGSGSVKSGSVKSGSGKKWQCQKVTVGKSGSGS